MINISNIKKSQRKESYLEVVHNSYVIRNKVTMLAENNFYITISKVDKQIQQRIKVLPIEEQIRTKENMYKYYKKQIERLTDTVIKSASDISVHLVRANTIYPTYKCEFNERRLELDKALESCNELQDELQYAGECLYADLNKYIDLVLLIKEEFNKIKKLRQSDNRFLNNLRD